MALGGCSRAYPTLGACSLLARSRGPLAPPEWRDSEGVRGSLAPPMAYRFPGVPCLGSSSDSAMIPRG